MVAIIAATLLIVIGVRFLWMLIMVRMVRSKKFKATGGLKSAVIMTLGGAKGTLTLALMFTLPMSFPLRNELIFVAGIAIVVTLLMANFILPMIAPKKNNTELEEVTPIVIEVLRRTVEELTANTTSENRRAVLAVVDSYTERIERLKQHIGCRDAKEYLDLRIEALNWEKDYIKQRLRKLKQDCSLSKQELLEVEACERLLDQIMNSLRHIHTDRQLGTLMWHVRGRLRALQRHIGTVIMRVSNMIRRTAPLLQEDVIFVHIRQLHIEVIQHVIERLYNVMSNQEYAAEYCSALLREYRSVERLLRSRPNVSLSVRLIENIEEVKRESYAIELRIIHDMYEAGDITRVQERQLRNNVYVMNVDTNVDM